MSIAPGTTAFYDDWAAHGQEAPRSAVSRHFETAFAPGARVLDVGCGKGRDVVALLDELGIDRVHLGGDLVGYGPHPNECIQTLAELGATCVAGNHDLIAIGKLDTSRCADKPAFTLKQTRKDLMLSTREALSALPGHLELDERTVAIHGGFDDPQEYLFAERKILANRARMKAAHAGTQLCLFGHTHEQAVWDLTGDTAMRLDASASVTLQGRDHTYFVNPGSVDASRKDGARLAEFAIFETSTSTVTFHRMPYDDVEVERRARAHGYRMSRADEVLYAGARKLRGYAAAIRRRLGA